MWHNICSHEFSNYIFLHGRPRSHLSQVCHLSKYSTTSFKLLVILYLYFLFLTDIIELHTTIHIFIFIVIKWFLHQPLIYWLSGAWLWTRFTRIGSKASFKLYRSMFKFSRGYPFMVSPKISEFHNERESEYVTCVCGLCIILYGIHGTI